MQLMLKSGNLMLDFNWRTFPEILLVIIISGDLFFPFSFRLIIIRISIFFAFHQHHVEGLTFRSPIPSIRYAC